MKYPYIPDKNMYKAVFSACKDIRNSASFDKSVEKAADYYGVGPEELAANIRERQAIGQRKANSTKSPGKYRWYIVREYTSIDTALNWDPRSKLQIIRAASPERAKSLFNQLDSVNFRRFDDESESHPPSFMHEIIGSQDGYESKQGALEALKECVK